MFGFLYATMLFIVMLPVFITYMRVDAQSSSCNDVCLEHGACPNNDGVCSCDAGWIGEFCNVRCGKKTVLTQLTGTISDGRNSYIQNSECSWIVRAPPNSTITFTFPHLNVECGWDYVYIFSSNDNDDNAAVNLAYLKGAFSGSLVPSPITVRGPEALVYFYSDTSYVLTGFNVTYQINTCPGNCGGSGRGSCVNNTCECLAGFFGSSCEMEICPNNCSNRGTCEESGCSCGSGWAGSDCGTADDAPRLIPLNVNDSLSSNSAAPPLAGHTVVSFLIDGTDRLLVFGGIGHDYKYTNDLHEYNGTFWNTVEATDGIVPSPRAHHTSVMYSRWMYMFGGRIAHNVESNELWRYDTISHAWKNLPSGHIPTAVAGHCSVVINNHMWVLNGYNGNKGYTRDIQVFDFQNENWELFLPSGLDPAGVEPRSFASTCTYVPHLETIFVFGGFVPVLSVESISSHLLFGFSVKTRHWSQYSSASFNGVREARFLHTAVPWQQSSSPHDHILVLGGYSYADRRRSNDCFSSANLVYDVACDRWINHTTIYHDPRVFIRENHFGLASAQWANGTVAIVGGFDGTILSRASLLHSTKCSSLITISACDHASCNWCSGLCRAEPCSYQCSGYDACQTQMTCGECVQNSSCIWCKSQERCMLQSRQSTSCHGRAIYSYSNNLCLANAMKPVCEMAISCYDCHTNSECVWNSSGRPSKPAFSKCSLRHQDERKAIRSCPVPCASQTSCEGCLSDDVSMCTWCASTGTCLAANAHIPSFPFGTCLQWRVGMLNSKVSDVCGSARCANHCNGNDCTADPRCGWCNSGTRPDVGRCVEGGTTGPIAASNLTCTLEDWNFSSSNCSKCQCNGHSSCDLNNRCVHCGNNTMGLHCERCIDGYYGKVCNNGSCQPCESVVSGHVCHSCDPLASHMRCTNCSDNTAGDLCDRCDDGFFGNATHGHCQLCNCNGNGMCNAISGVCDDCDAGYEGIFCERCSEFFVRNNDICYRQLEPHSNHYFNSLKPNLWRFIIIPMYSNDMNITVVSVDHQPLLISVMISEYRNSSRRLLVSSESIYEFAFVIKPNGDDLNDYDFNDAVIFVEVKSSSKAEFYIYYRYLRLPMNLVHFFVTFFVSFFALLTLAFITWRAKMRFDQVRSQRIQFTELQMMASRPLVFMKLSDVPGTYTSQYPTPASIEYLANGGGRVAVVSVLVDLPMKRDSEQVLRMRKLSVGVTVQYLSKEMSAQRTCTSGSIHLETRN